MKNNFENLLNKLYELVQLCREYSKTCSKLNNILREATNEKLDTNQSRQYELLRKLQEIEKLIAKVIQQIDALFNDVRFQPADEQAKDEVHQTLIELVGYTYELAGQIIARQNNTKIVNLHKKVLKDLDILKNNINVYNDIAKAKKWPYIFTSFQDAKNIYAKMIKKLEEDSEERIKAFKRKYIRPSKIKKL